jgi:predicted negative regulator of RcsB-dependent stress response
MVQQGDTVYYFEIKIDFLKDTVTTDEKVHKVLGSNEECFVLDDKRFTRLQYKDEKYGLSEPFKKAQVCKSHFKPYWDYIQGDIYTDNKSKKIAHNAIKKALKEYMYEQYGRYCKGIDLLDALKEE